MLFFEATYSSLFLNFAIPVLKTLSLSLPTALKRAKSVEVGLAQTGWPVGHIILSIGRRILPELIGFAGMI
jgi:hypothetical protein